MLLTAVGPSASPPHQVAPNWMSEAERREPPQPLSTKRGRGVKRGGKARVVTWLVGVVILLLAVDSIKEKPVPVVGQCTSPPRLISNATHSTPCPRRPSNLTGKGRREVGACHGLPHPPVHEVGHIDSVRQALWSSVWGLSFWSEGMIGLWKRKRYLGGRTRGIGVITVSSVMR